MLSFASAEEDSSTDENLEIITVTARQSPET